LRHNPVESRDACVADRHHYPAATGTCSVDADEVRRAWATRSGAYSPAYYAHHGPDATSEWVVDAVTARLGETATVLEVGCSSGRHLERFRRAGFDSLAGIEVNPEALTVMRESFPELAAQATFHHGDVEAILTDWETDAVDVVYAVETFQHLPATAFDEIARVAGELIVTAENEGDADTSDGVIGEVTRVADGVPLYYRDWGQVFGRRGFSQVAGPDRVGDRDTGRVLVARDEADARAE
jgi:SAM-dependent methyltransferase